jgi:hypothetical protein
LEASVAVSTNPAQVAGLHFEIERTMAFIDDALDRGDKRAFRMWSIKHRSLSVRLSGLLVKLATADI